MGMAKRVVVLLLVAAVLGAVAYMTYREPTAEKAERLRQEMDARCAIVEIHAVPTAEQKANCDLATRKFNKFMGN